MTTRAFVGPVITGQPLWGISKRIGETVDDIESKICKIEVDVSVLGESLCSKIEGIESIVDSLTVCASTGISSADISDDGIITISSSGLYCLSEDVTADIDITANCVALDLNKHCVTGVVTISSDDVDVRSGNITPPAPSLTPVAGITVEATSDRAKISDVVIVCADTTADTIAGRVGIEILGNDTQIFDVTVKSGAGESTGATGTAGGNGIIVGATANNVIIKNSFISTGDGGDGTTDGADGGHGLVIQASATETEVTDCTILSTGNGGNGGGAGTNGNGGDGVNIQAGALDTVIRNCTIRNTGAAGTGGSGGSPRAGRAVTDAVTTVANLSMVYANFAHNIANSVKYALQGTIVERGIALANPPTTGAVNPYANVFVS